MMRSYRQLFTVFAIILLISQRCYAQDSLEVNKKKLVTFIASSSAIYGLSLIGLNELWYKDFPREKFHFFDDSKEWNQIDKLGHAYTAYQISNVGYLWLKSANVQDRKAYLYGGLVGVLFMTPIEILDGYSSEYGASISDMVFNFGGAAFYAAQGVIWKEQRLIFKISFQRTEYASLRPSVLGENYIQEAIKDYNGHTGWISVDLYSFMKKESNFPKWLNVAVGYGAQEMIYANNVNNKAFGLNPYRQYYLGLDIDLSHIPTKSKFLKALLKTVNLIHLPAPTLEFTEKGKIRFHPLYF